MPANSRWDLIRRLRVNSNNNNNKRDNAMLAFKGSQKSLVLRTVAGKA